MLIKPALHGDELTWDGSYNSATVFLWQLGNNARHPPTELHVLPTNQTL